MFKKTKAQSSRAVKRRFWRNIGRISLFRLIWWALYISAGIWLFQNWYNDIPFEKIKEQYSYPDSKFIPIDGMEIHCRIRGKGPETMLLLHDEGNSLQTWNNWIDSFSRNMQIIAVDLPGFGLTGPHSKGSYSTFMYATFIDSLAERLNLSKFHLAGNGIGAQIAWFYASEHPNRLGKLVLIAAPGFEEKSFDPLYGLARTPVVNRVFWKITPKSAIKIHLETHIANDDFVNDSLTERYFELFLRPGNRKAFTDRMQVRDNHPPVSMIENIQTPTLILWGAEDTRISPQFAYEFHRKIKNSLLKIYPNTGHWPQQENPSATFRDVSDFLKGQF